VEGSEPRLNKVLALLKKVLRGEELEGGETPSQEKPNRPAASRPQSGGRTTSTGLPPPPPSKAGGLSRAQAEELVDQWNTARRAKDYGTADGLRDRLRKAGYNPEEVLEEISLFGYSEEFEAPALGSAPQAASSASQPVEAASDDPLAYQPTVPPKPAHWGPTDAIKNHKDGGTGGLLTLNYQTVVPLPPDIGFTVTSGNISATADSLLALKRVQEEEAERERQMIRERNAMAHGEALLQRRAAGRLGR